jgi:hypothetical protein
VETHHVDPFNFLITDPAALSLPSYQPNLEVALSHYLKRSSASSGRCLYARNNAGREFDTITFLMLRRAGPTRKYMLREHGDSWTAEETLRHGEGACRDFSVLFIEACRSAGIAARFVSGYCLGDVASDTHMHAWAEVYLPGAGWRGFDPSRGVTTSDDHIAVAASYSPQDASPTDGSFRGEAAASMEAEILISVLDKIIWICRHTFEGVRLRLNLPVEWWLANVLGRQQREPLELADCSLDGGHYGSLFTNLHSSSRTHSSYPIWSDLIR